MRLHEKLKCEGFYGFAIGYSQVTDTKQEFCNICPLRQECWDKHKIRTAQLLPVITEAFEQMAQEIKGPELIRRWYEAYNVADPYLTVMGGNIEDGITYARTGVVKDRGEFTLPYPPKEAH